MAWFGQGRDTIEWLESKEEILFYKWPANEIKQDSKLIIRAGQKAIFFAGGVVEGVFEEPGTYDIVTEIVPFLSTLYGFFQLRGDTGLRAEVYFVNNKELLLRWGTRQRIMIPTPEAPAGIPVGCNGNLIVMFRDYRLFIEKVAGVRDSYTLADVSERIIGDLNPIVAEAILDGHETIGTGALVSLQQNSRRLGKRIGKELDEELGEFGLGVADLNIQSINYPQSVQKMAEKAAAQSFVQDVGKYTAVAAANSMENPATGSNLAGQGVQLAMGVQMAKQMTDAMEQKPAAPARSCGKCGHPLAAGARFCSECGASIINTKSEQCNMNDKFCSKCRKMTSGKFCQDCGSETV